MLGAEKKTGTSTMRTCLANGETLEVAGYELAPDLATAIDSLKAAELVVRKSTIHWFEIVAEPGRSMPPAGAKVIGEWKRSGVDPHVHLVACSPFWATQEISECPELVSATADCLYYGRMMNFERARPCLSLRGSLAVRGFEFT